MPICRLPESCGKPCGSSLRAHCWIIVAVYHTVLTFAGTAEMLEDWAR
jgi:hypothetical protein